MTKGETMSEPSFPECPTCHMELEWIECDAGCDDGYRDAEMLMEEDPLWYGPDDFEMCGECLGAGGFWYCVGCAVFHRSTYRTDKRALDGAGMEP